MREAIQAFSKALQEQYGPLEVMPEPDGSIHRFDVPGDKPGRRNGWYVLHANGIASGAFGSWKHGDCHTWTSRAPADQREARHLRQQIEQARRQREAEQRMRQQAAADKARILWRQALPAEPAHPYLLSKCVQPHGLRQIGQVLLVPLSIAGQLVNIQRIEPDGSKRFLSGGRVKGCCSPIGSIQPGQPLYLCEGWATGATIHESTGAAVACSMNAGNLLPAGELLRQRYPDAVLIVAGDDDRLTEGNPGRTAAEKTAEALGCQFVMPAWPDNAPLSLSDFNDLTAWREGCI